MTITTKRHDLWTKVDKAKHAHGGPGRNQGRKEMDPQKKKQTYATRLDPEVIEIIRNHKPSSKFIESAVRCYEKILKCSQ